MLNVGYVLKVGSKGGFDVCGLCLFVKFVCCVVCCCYWFVVEYMVVCSDGVFDLVVMCVIWSGDGYDVGFEVS